MASSSSGLAFFDTNVLIYQFDKHSPKKQATAQDLVDEYVKYDRAVISTQIVQEFMNVALRKFDSAFEDRDVALVMEGLLQPMLRHYPSMDFYFRGLELFQPNPFSFYDTMIVQAALDLGCDTLFSEDMQDGYKFGTLTIVNPFKK